MEQVYLVNFPRENAIKGQEFKGNSDLEKELLNRNIIGEGKSSVEAKDDSGLEEKVTDLQGQVATLSGEKLELEGKVTDLQGQVATISGEKDIEIERLKSLIEEAINLPKNTRPDGYQKES